MSNLQDHSDTLNWYAIYSHPKQEGRAANNLRAWGVETFNPQFKEISHNRYTGAPVVRIKELFPRYIFARFRANQLLHKVCFTRGVKCVVGFGSSPLQINDDIIEIIKSRVGADGYISVDEQFKAGDKVAIKEGPFRNFMGVFDRKIKNTGRVRILLETISYEGYVIIGQESIRKL